MFIKNKTNKFFIAIFSILFIAGLGIGLHTVNSMAEEQETDLINSYSVTLGKSIALNYYVDKSVGAQAYLTVGGQKIEDYTEDESNYIFTYQGIVPQKINEIYTVEVFNSQGESKGTKETSVLSYCKGLLSKSQSQLNYSTLQYEKMQNIVADLLVYGSKAQDYMSDEIITEHISDILSDYSLSGSSYDSYQGTDKAFELKSENTQDTFAIPKSATLDLSYNVEMVLKFDVSNNIDGAVVTVDGNDYQNYKMSKQNGVIEISKIKISSTQFDAPVKVALTYQGQEVGYAVTYTVNTYIASKTKTTEDSENKELAKALYAYGKSAQAYQEETDKSYVILGDGITFDEGLTEKELQENEALPGISCLDKTKYIIGFLGNDGNIYTSSPVENDTNSIVHFSSNNFKMANKNIFLTAYFAEKGNTKSETEGVLACGVNGMAKDSVTGTACDAIKSCCEMQESGEDLKIGTLYSITTRGTINSDHQASLSDYTIYSYPNGQYTITYTFKNFSNQEINLKFYVRRSLATDTTDKNIVAVTIPVGELVTVEMPWKVENGSNPHFLTIYSFEEEMKNVQLGVSATIKNGINYTMTLQEGLSFKDGTNSKVVSSAKKLTEQLEMNEIEGKVFKGFINVENNEIIENVNSNLTIAPYYDKDAIQTLKPGIKSSTGKISVAEVYSSNSTIKPKIQLNNCIVKDDESFNRLADRYTLTNSIETGKFFDVFATAKEASINSTSNAIFNGKVYLKNYSETEIKLTLILSGSTTKATTSQQYDTKQVTIGAGETVVTVLSCGNKLNNLNIYFVVDTDMPNGIDLGVIIDGTLSRNFLYVQATDGAFFQGSTLKDKSFIVISGGLSAYPITYETPEGYEVDYWYDQDDNHYIVANSSGRYAKIVGENQYSINGASYVKDLVFTPHLVEKN